uniref:GTF3C1 extended winged-helix domain-containing protein n=1 Tax=Aphanomyces invadans TaxID=157072 RepID=A0A024TW47_9STRA|nr:hypothetical protein H310_08966 [Aphanomyces invadans]ETV98248.1 hypothetical protein H310_08966 [Aphanomyces invadans]|eukprot:XP_008873123.1 hypothetical protein H310_08966 [Aphanomyces invadans]
MAASDGAATTTTAPRWSVFKVLQVLYENIALEGRNGISVRRLFHKFEPSGDVHMHAMIWAILRRGCSPTNPVQVAHNPQISMQNENDSTLPSSISTTMPKKRKAPAKTATKKKRKKMSPDSEVSDSEEAVCRPSVSKPSSSARWKSGPAPTTALPQHDLAPLDASDIPFDAAMADPMLVLVATYDIRLQALGYSKVGVDISAILLDVLEMIGRTRCIGITVSCISDTLFNGDIKRMHYFLDELVAMNLVEKRILTLPPRRFNIIHLKRFAALFDPHTMGFAGFYFEHEPNTKAILVNKLLRSMQVRNEETAVFPDVAKRFGLQKRQQESLRNYICQEATKNPLTCPLHMFMATCHGGERSTGRKLWCVRVVDTSANTGSSITRGGNEFTFPLAHNMGGAEYLYRLVDAASPEGITIPEVKDVCGNPDNKWVYKKMQRMLIHHNVVSERVMGSRSVVHKFSVVPTIIKSEEVAAPTTAGVGVGIGRYASIRQSIQNSGHRLVGDVFVERQAFLMDQIHTNSIVSVGYLRRTLCAHENRQGTHGIDGRTILRLLQPLVDDKTIEFIDVNVPWKKVSGHTRVRCVALPFVMKEESQATLRKFLDQYSPLDDLDSTIKWVDSSFSIVREDHLRQRQLNAADAKSKQNIVALSHNISAFNAARQRLKDHHRQCRRLGQAYGMMCRARLLHVAICRALVRMKVWPTTALTLPSVDKEARIEFKFQDVMAHTSVQDYCQIFGTPEALSEAQEAAVKQVIYAGNSMNISDQWKRLGAVGKVLQRNQRNRAKRMVDILVDFKLLHRKQPAPLQHESVYSSDVDEMVSRVVDQTVHGGVLLLNLHVFVAVVDERASTPLRLRGVLRPVGFGPLPEIPLEYSFNDVDQVITFWRLLEVFYLEKARWECMMEPPMPDQPPMFVKPYLVPSINATLSLLWTDSGSLQRQKVGIMKTRAKPKKRVFSSNLINPNPKWKLDARAQRIEQRRQQPLRIKTPRRKPEKIALTPDHEEAALASYMDKIVNLWQVDVPLELRFDQEETTFINSRVWRGRVNWNAIGLEVGWPMLRVGATRPYVGLEVKRRLLKHCLPRPIVKKQLMALEAAEVAAKNPTGRFLEEVMIQSDPRVYGCLVKAVQMMLQPDAEYDSAVADDLLTPFSTLEMKIVWRYLYFAGKVNRSKPADTGHRRGYAFSLAMFDFLRLNATQWPLTMCLDAAEHMGAMSTLQEDGMEMQMPSNASAGFMATLLAGHVQGTVDLDVTFEQTKDGVYGSMTNLKAGRSFKDNGFIGHMHRFTNGRSYDEFNMDWVLSTKASSASATDDCWEVFTPRKRKRCDGEGGEQHDDDDDDVEWTCLHAPSKPCTSMKRCRNLVVEALAKAIDAKEGEGTTATDLANNLFPHATSQRRRQQVQEALDQLVTNDRVCDVHAYNCVRYVASAHAKPWMVFPYAYKKKVAEFNRDEPLIARPWLKMNGTTNEAFMVVMKREITMLVAERPGIGEVHMSEYFKGLLGLQDVRCLCFQLIDDRVIYSRVSKKRKRCRLFSGAPSLPEEPVVGEYSMDRDEFEMHYFPSVDCFGQLGNAVQELL